MTLSNGPWVLIRPFMPPGMRTMHFATLDLARQPHDTARRNGRARDRATIRGPDNYCEKCGPNIGDEWHRVYEDRRKHPEDEQVDGESVDG